LAAAILPHGLAEKAIADLIYQLGEERRARKIARAIVRARPQKAMQCDPKAGINGAGRVSNVLVFGASMRASRAGSGTLFGGSVPGDFRW
jgi:hypothetical protein